ncbi:sulfite exporter TauE/SafE family protein [Pontibacter sp. BT310]|uniref:Probable membrane transporter protein n=1 Tax=Pontibacter populi TaxID=890055 RepID=A0ABS6XEQ4_9BACT|nr:MULTISPECIES: sulfite exporter TauE/SafE family protein [Pontibacter]MBJ6119610.1 sulfite exporter TauE/SafE family protein [Pontibacter sp. BT310]MBR0572037.1 sulfite exporter TauE/SafE family protein [Microvirga sp. STS03]MBW3366463.1 sulfite exporter TauE/SafE family protein [Pontibacter populi]
MEILGYIAAMLIGLSLGLIGGGGSILTVPVLVYLLGLSPVISTAYSLFIVGLTSLVGSYKFYQKGLVSLKTAIVFGLPSIVAVYITRRYLVPAIPENLFTVGDLAVTKGVLLMLLFASLMVFASISMIKKKKEAPAEPIDAVDENIDTKLDVEHTDLKETHPKPKFNYGGILAEGLVVGTLTGLVGAGGGFLIIPALVLFSKLDMKMAVGTSLLIIAVKSLFGFMGDVFNYEIDWMLLGIFSTISIAGIFIGTYLSAKVHADKLKTSFGWFVLVMGIYIIIKELFFA